MWCCWSHTWVSWRARRARSALAARSSGYEGDCRVSFRHSSRAFRTTAPNTPRPPARRQPDAVPQPLNLLSDRRERNGLTLRPAAAVSPDGPERYNRLIVEFSPMAQAEVADDRAHLEGRRPGRRRRRLRRLHPRDRLRRVRADLRQPRRLDARRDKGDRTEFITPSLWDSVDAIRAFAGNDIEAAVLYPEDQRHLIGGESTVTHYQVVDQAEAPSGSGQGA